ncbi:unnamed protein product [Victoria cruziana]
MRNLLRIAPRCARSFLSSSSRLNPSIGFIGAAAAPARRFFSVESGSSSGDSNPPSEPPAAENATTANEIAPTETDKSLQVEDVGTKELSQRIWKYFKGDEEALGSVMEAILARRLTGNHEETDDELMDELRFKPLDDVRDQEFESDFEELHETDNEIDNLYNARQYVEKKLMKDEFFNMSSEKYDDMIKEATEKGFLQDTGKCEEILEDMLNWDKLLPDEIKKKVESKYYELCDMCERGELEPIDAYEQFKKFEDQVVQECADIMAAEQPTEDIGKESDRTKNLDDPPGEGPILRWETRVVFGPGGDAYHPKNRKVKLSVTVKELGLSKYAYRRLREVVGKRYHPGKDELTIISERFEHREENRKDCLRTLYALIDDAEQADKLVAEARTDYLKQRLRGNPEFMQRLRSHAVASRSLSASPA